MAAFKKRLFFLRFLIPTVMILAVVIFYQNCGPNKFDQASTGSGGPGTQGSPVSCARIIDPASCPLSATASPVTINGTCPNCDPVNSISRYQALVMAYQYRGTSLCVTQMNFFPTDTFCDPNTGLGDPKLCTPISNGPNGVSGAVNARDCVDAAASAPSITAGVGSGTFGQTQITKAQAVTFAYKAADVPNCSSQGVDPIANLLADTAHISARQAVIGYNSVLWPYVFVAVVLGISNSTSPDSGAVSNSTMQSYMDGFYHKLLDAGTGYANNCSAMNNFIMSPNNY